MEIVIASNNQDKVEEIRRICRLEGVRYLTLKEFPDIPTAIEDGNTLYENALKKATMVADYTGYATLADDTGLEVEALDGRPGIHSARYAGERASYEDNIQKLLTELQSVPMARRSARFRCVALYYHRDTIISAEGTVAGVILDRKRGCGGFGYDPVFYIPTLHKTFAELSAAEKNAISHRGRAFSALHHRLAHHFSNITSK